MIRSVMTRTESHTQRPRKSRTPAQLNARLDKGLLAYAAAASAAGVSLLALVQPAEGKIVYTKANHEIAPGKMLGLSLNHDGSSDFSLYNKVVSTTYQIEFVDALSITPQGKNGILGNASAVLGSGVSVGPKGKFQGGPQKMVTFSQSCRPSSTKCQTLTLGGWKNITNGYLGMKFYINGKAHYGWARLNVTVTNGGVYALLTGYAYETIANKGIITGKTKGAADDVGHGSPTTLSSDGPEVGTLGELAQGAGPNGMKYQARRNGQ